MKTNQFYCVKCKCKVSLHDSHIAVTTLKNKRPALTGKCGKCDTKLCKFVKAADETKLRSQFRRSSKKSKRAKKSKSKKRSKKSKKKSTKRKSKRSKKSKSRSRK